MVLGKFLGLLITIQIFNLPWSLKEYTNSFFTVGATLRSEDIATATSYSDLIMYMFLAIMFSILVIRAVYFHSTHVSPTLVAKLVDKNLLNLVKSSYDIYHSAFVWLVFSWIANILILINVFSSKTFLWVAIVCTTSSLILTTMLIQDVYKEIENIKKHPGEYVWF